MDEIDRQTQEAFDVVPPPRVEDWAEPTERKDTLFETAYKFSAPGFKEAYERAMKAGGREGVAGMFPEPNSRLESAYQSALGYFADMGLAGMQAADAAFQFALGAVTEAVPGQDSDQEMRLARDLYGMSEAAMGNPAGAARAVDDVVESAGRMGQQAPAFLAAEEGAIKVPRFKKKVSNTPQEITQALPDPTWGIMKLGDLFFDPVGGTLSDGTPLSYAPNITLHDVANIILGRKTPEEVLDYYGNDPSPELLDYLNYRTEDLKGFKDFEEYLDRYKKINSPYDPWDYIGEDPAPESLSPFTSFRSAIPEVIDQINFPEQGIKGSQLLKEIQDSPSIRMSEWRSLGVDIDPQKRYSKKEVSRLVTDNLWEVKAFPENRWSGYQRQKDIQDEEKDYFEFAIDATRKGPTFQARGQHFGEGTLAHVRASVREGQQGDYILVEELQSDLLQHGFEAPRKKKAFPELVDELKREVESLRYDFEDIISDDSDIDGLGSISTAKIDPYDFKKNDYARYSTILETIPIEELQEAVNQGGQAQNLLLKYSRELPEEVRANDIRFVISNLGQKDYRNKDVAEPPVAKTEEGVRLAFDALLDKAVKEGIDKIVIPPFERIVERRFDVDTESYENALKPTSGFYATYIKSVNKVLKEYEQEFGKENISYRLEPLNYPSNSSDPLFKLEKIENLDFELSLALGDLNKTSFDSWKSYLDKGFLKDYITYYTSPSGEIYFPETGRDTTIRSFDGFLPDLQQMAEKAVNENTLPSGLSVDEFESVLYQVSEDGLGLARVENAFFREGFLPLSEFKVPNDAPDLPTEGLVIDISKLKDTPYDFSNPKFNKGGLATKGVDEQMRQIFEKGGMADDGMDRDPVSGNEVPPGSLAKEVRDDVPAQLSEGEYVVPADVVRYFGVAYFEKLREKAKAGMGKMEEDGRIGGEPADVEMAKGGVVKMAEGGMALRQTPPFNPNQYAYGGTKFTMPGSFSGTESRIYVNAAGNRRAFLFINGQPLSEIPAGFVPDTPEGRKNLGAAAPTGENVPAANAPAQDKGPFKERESRGEEEGQESGTPNIDPKDNLFNLSEEDLLDYGMSGGFGKVGKALGMGIASINPLTAAVSAGLGLHHRLEPLSNARAAAMVAEERGLTDVAAKLNSHAEKLQKDLGVGTNVMADVFATGKSQVNRHRTAYESYPGTAPSPTSTGLPATPTRNAVRTGSDGSREYNLTSSDISRLERAGLDMRGVGEGTAANQEELDILRTDYGPQLPGSTRDSGDSEQRRQAQEATASIRAGEREAEGATSPSRQIDSEAYSGRGYTTGRATGGLVTKPKAKPAKKPRRKIKTVEK